MPLSIIRHNAIMKAILSLPHTITILVLGVLAFVAPSLANLNQASPIEFKPEKKHERATLLINHFVQSYHYKKTELDDSLSEKILQKYLESLDPNRSYLLQQDVVEFEKHRFEFDNYLHKHQLEPAYAVFSVFRDRVDQRVNYALDVLESEFDFDIEESYRFDRRDAPWAGDSEELDDIWYKRVKNDILSLRLTDKEHDEIIETLRSRYTQLGRRTAQLNQDDIYQIFINAYMSSIEPHTSYFSPRASDNFKIRMSLSLEGIGAVLQTENEYTIVRRVVPGGPADLSGELQSGDRIIGVGQGQNNPLVDVIGWRLDDVVELIRGPKDSIVRLQILSDGTGTETSEVVELTRDKIKLEEQAAKKSILELPVENNDTVRIGVIDIPTFYIDFAARSRGDQNYRSTTRDVKKLLAELDNDDIDGLIIDLRGNGGGALTEAITVTGLFIESGPVVQVKNAGGKIEVNRDPDPDVMYDGPLAVLVDRNSASASEIFAGAIQDYKRGLIIGEPTYGKGTVQNLISLDQYADNKDIRLGQLKITIAQFFRINGDSTQRRGIVPDIVFPTAADSVDEGERALENSLAWTTIQPAQYVPYGDLSNPDVLVATRTLHEDRIIDEPGFQFLMGEAEIRRELDDKIHVSLREGVRRAEMANQSQRREEIENSLLAGEDKILDTDDDLDIESILLTEAGQILADFVYNKHASLTVKRDNSQSSTASNIDKPLASENTATKSGSR